MPAVPPPTPPADASHRHTPWALTPRPGLVAALVAFLTLACIALWAWQHLRTQTLLRDQLVAQAEKRSLQLADAMAGQVAGLFTTIDLALLQLRNEWAASPQGFDGRVRDLLGKLPQGPSATSPWWMPRATRPTTPCILVSGCTWAIGPTSWRIRTGRTA